MGLASNTCVVSPTIPLPGLGIAVRYTDRDVAQVLADLPAILADGRAGPAAPSAGPSGQALSSSAAQATGGGTAASARS